MSKLARILLGFTDIEQKRGRESSKQRLHLIGSELADLVQLSQGRETKPVVIQSGLIRLEDLLNFIRQRQTQVVHQLNVFCPRMPCNAWIDNFLIRRTGRGDLLGRSPRVK